MIPECTPNAISYKGSVVDLFYHDHHIHLELVSLPMSPWYISQHYQNHNKMNRKFLREQHLAHHQVAYKTGNNRQFTTNKYKCSV